MKNLSALISRLERATEGSRELDTMIARDLFGWHAWKSKHGYWNLERPSSWPTDWLNDIGRSHTLAGRHPEHVYNQATGERLPPETEPSDYAEDIGAPEFTSSLDAAVDLLKRKLPHVVYTVRGNADLVEGHTAECDLTEFDSENIRFVDVKDGRSHHFTAALAVCLATARALST